jgi:hypothetical protein
MDLAGTQHLFNSITGRDDLKLENAEYISEWTANIRMTDRFSVGRVFLAGDVAHCHSPAGGQGTNTAMQDAFNLAWKLALVVNKKASPDLLKSYEAERMPVIAEMLNLSNALHARAFPHIPQTAFATPQTSDTQPDPMQRTRNMLQLGINYRWSDIVFDERYHQTETAEKNPYGSMNNQIRAGDRAPYIGNLAAGEKTTDIFSLLRGAPSHLVLIFSASSLISSDLLSTITTFTNAGLAHFVVIVEGQQGYGDKSEGVQYLVDSQGIARKAYLSEDNRDAYVIIRPDGIVGAYTFGADGIRKYFALIGASV